MTVPEGARLRLADIAVRPLLTSSNCWDDDVRQAARLGAMSVGPDATEGLVLTAARRNAVDELRHLHGRRFQRNGAYHLDYIVEDDLTLGDILEAPGSDPADWVIDMRGYRLTAKEQQVLARLYDGHTVTEIADELGVTQSAVSHVRASIQSKARELMAA